MQHGHSLPVEDRALTRGGNRDPNMDDGRRARFESIDALAGILTAIGHRIHRDIVKW